MRATIKLFFRLRVSGNTVYLFKERKNSVVCMDKQF